ncbi:flagellar biosynthetic protein FliR [Buchnera aphidicola (Mollitrichosiphum nigrofasciatum)]|uniref:flagellar biosynthetic protein FliR n=1 Tax=Buchnera aphidicola TaxID=9 RepID=UPI0031B86A0B
MINNFLYNNNFNSFINYFVPIFTRIIGIIYIAPVFSEKIVSYKIKMFFSIILTFFLCSFLPRGYILHFSFIGVLVIFQEFVIGFFIGLTFKLIFVISSFCGDIIGTQMGLSFATFFDVNNRYFIPIVLRLINYCTYMVFFIFNMHLWVISVLVKSFYTIPIGSFILKNKFLNLVFFFSNVFIQGLKMFFPVILLLIILNLVFLFLNRILIPAFFFSLNFSLFLLFGMLFLYSFFPLFIINFKIAMQKILFFLLDII